MLHSFDIPVGKSWNVVIYSQGWWHMSKALAVSHAMNPNWFARQGLLSLYLILKV
jgi:hypothetical protein